MTQIQLYDTTLRDGMQGRSMVLSVEDQMRVVHHLDSLGIEVIEAGFPGSNPKERELFDRLATERLKHAQIAAFGMTRRRDVRAEEDPALVGLAECFAPICTIVGKTWMLHLEKVVRVDKASNLRMISESVAFLRERGKRVVYDAEHFFDGWRADREYALECLRAAADAGAEAVVPCDTNGASLPHEISEAIGEVTAAFAGMQVRVGVHCHNDAECGVANTLAGVMAGASQVQGTINGYGERCGNANLVSIVPNLQLKLGYKCVSKKQLGLLTETAHFVDELVNRTPNPDQPYVGKNAFAHKGGLHIAGVIEDPETFEHIAPALVGNKRELLVSELSGKGTVRAHADSAEIQLTEGQTRRVVERVKELEHAGYQFEAADGSFELLMRKEAGLHVRLFEFESWHVHVEKRGEEEAQTRATIKLWVPDKETGESYMGVAEGDGPVHALDQALRNAIRHIYRDIDKVKLVNYRVRILDERKGTAAAVCVLLDATDSRGEIHGSTGVSTNVVEASWQALIDSLEYGLRKNAPATPRDTSALKRRRA